MVRSGSARLIAAVLLMIVAVGVLRVGATSFNPLPFERDLSAPAMVPGDIVFLFHSGTGEVRDSLNPGATVGVSRVDSEGNRRSVGTLRVAAFVGEFCLRSEVTEGEILLHDLAERDHIYYRVIPEILCRR